MLRVVFSVVLLGWVGSVQAYSIWDNGSYITNTTPGGNCSDCGTAGWSVFDDFIFTENSVISSVEFDAAFSGSASLYKINVGVWSGVGTDLISMQSFDLDSELGISLIENIVDANYTISIDLNDIELFDGTYLLSLQGQKRDGSLGYMTFSHDADNGYGSNAIQYNMVSGTTYYVEYDVPFRLNGVTRVSEPPVIAHMGFGLLGLFGLSRRRIKTQK